MSGNRWNSAFFEGGGSLWAQISERSCIAHQPLLVSEDWSDWRFVWYQNIRSPPFSFVTIHASDLRTDRRTDGRIEFRQQYRALHYMQSHGKNNGLDQYMALNISNSSNWIIWRWKG